MPENRQDASETQDMKYCKACGAFGDTGADLVRFCGGNNKDACPFRHAVKDGDEWGDLRETAEPIEL